MDYRSKKKQKSSRLLLVTIAAIVVIGAASGCIATTGTADTADETVRSLFHVQEALSEVQARWIIIGEALLVFFLVLLVILLIMLFRRYRKIEKQAMEASIRERTLMKENEMLDRLSRMKTEFFQNMSHDFKTPLTIISTSVLNAMDVLDFEMDKKEIRESLNLAQIEVMRMSRIVDGALKHTAMHDNKQRGEPIDIVILLNMVSKTYNAFLDRRGNTLITTVDKDIPLAYCNADTLLNVMANLISNSNRFTRNGEIIISASLSITERQLICITVKDNGIGVSPEVLENIFSRGASETGSGLGLHICKTAIESYGGAISIESKEGKGTKVTFTVPVYKSKKDSTEEK